MTHHLNKNFQSKKSDQVPLKGDFRCLKLAEGSTAYKFERERDAVWYKRKDIVKTMSNVPSLIHSRGVYYTKFELGLFEILNNAVPYFIECRISMVLHNSEATKCIKCTANDLNI